MTPLYARFADERGIVAHVNSRIYTYRFRTSRNQVSLDVSRDTLKTLQSPFTISVGVAITHTISHDFFRVQRNDLHSG
jgi:hypothetical protein